MYARFLAYLLKNSRPQFHGAASALAYFVVFLLITGVTVSVVNLFSQQFRGDEYTFNWPILGMLAGMTLFAELLRGHVKLLLRKKPEEWSFVAAAITGAVVGALFQGYMELLWSETTWTKVLVCAASGAGIGVTLAVLSFWGEKDKQKKAGRG